MEREQIGSRESVMFDGLKKVMEGRLRERRQNLEQICHGVIDGGFNFDPLLP